MPLKDIESRKAYSREYHIRNREEILRRHAEYRGVNRDNINRIQNEKYILNKEAIAQKQKEYRDKNPEKGKEASKKYRMANKEKIKKKNSIWREKNKEVLSEKSKEKYALNKEQIDTANSVYIKTPKGKYSKCKSNAKRRGIEFDVSLEDFAKFSEHECCYCGTEMEAIGIDRVDNSRGYIFDNMVACCVNCNFMKQQHSRDDFFEHCIKILKHQGIIL
ncbi:MAG: hypothetical protein V3R78_10180 [Thermodesulfobacteriota bacterium]